MLKGIILGGGEGTRLFPATLGVCKQLLPVYDKPLIYYPLSILMFSGVREVLIISTPQDLPRFKQVLGNGSDLGMRFSYAEQSKPRGIGDAFVIGESFLGKDEVCLILGDNIFFGHGLPEVLKTAALETQENKIAVFFVYPVADPSRYGVLEFDEKENGKAACIREKPPDPKSNFAVTGLYFYPNDVVSLAKKLTPSARGEIEITDVNNHYIRENRFDSRILGRGCAWLDTGTPESLLEAGNFVATIEKRQGFKIGCVEEVAYRMGYISRKQLLALAKPLQKSGYGGYLEKIARD